MDKTTSAKPLKPTIGSKLQNNPFLNHSQSSPNNNSNNNSQKLAPVKKKTTTPAWLQKQEFSSSKRASLQKMSQKVSSNPWKKDSGTKSSNLPTVKKSPISKLPTLSTTTTTTTTSTNSSKVSSSSTVTSAPITPRSAKVSPKVPIKQDNQKAETKNKVVVSEQSRTMDKPTMGTKDKVPFDQPEAVDKLETGTKNKVVSEQPKAMDKPTTETESTLSGLSDGLDATDEPVKQSSAKIADEPMIRALVKSIDEPPVNSTNQPVVRTPVNSTDQPIVRTLANPTDEPAMQIGSTSPSPVLARRLSNKLSIDTSNVIDNTTIVNDLPSNANGMTDTVSPVTNDQPLDTDPHLSLSPVQSAQMSKAISLQTTELVSPVAVDLPRLSLRTVNKSEINVDSSPPKATLYQQQPGSSSAVAITSTNSLFEIALPWSQHTQEQLQQIEKQQNAAITADYDTFFQQLAVSHAISSSLFFPTVSFDQAQKLQKKYLKSNDHIDMIGTRLLMETKAQRMILSMHKLSTTHTMPDVMEEKESDRLDQVDRLVEELIQWMHRDYSRREQYLQHLAGTLAKQCTYLEQINHSINTGSSPYTISTTDATLMMKKETQWIMALRHDIIQLFEHHLPTVTLPPSPVMSPSQSLSSHSIGSSTTGLPNDDNDAFFNSSRTSMTSTMTDQQAHLYHRHHQNMVFEMKQFIQLLDQQLASSKHTRPDDSVGSRTNFESKLATEKQLNDTLASQMTRLQEKWDQEVERNQALMDDLEGRRRSEDKITLALEEERRRTQQLETRLGNHRQEQEEDQDKLDEMEESLEQERRTNQALEHQLNEKDRLVRELQSQLAHGSQHQRSIVDQYLDGGDATVEMALAQLAKERDEAKMESQEWQIKIHGLETEMHEWKTKAEGLEMELHDCQSKAHGQAMDWQTKVHDLEMGLQEWQTRAQGLDVDLHEWQTKAQGLDVERHDLETQAQKLDAERHEWQTEAQRLDVERQEWQTKAQALDMERHEWQTKAQGLDAELQTRTQTIEELHNGRSASAVEADALKLQLQQLLAEKQGHEEQQQQWQLVSKDSTDRLTEAQQHIQTLTRQIADFEHQQQHSSDQEDWRQKYLDTETRLETAQQQFTHRESGYLLQSASVEAELEQILKEYDRLTRHIVDFNSERKKYEEQISDMNHHQHRLDQQLADLQVQYLGVNDSQNTTMALRKEFRQLMAQTKTIHHQQLEKEQQLRSVLEQERRDEKQELERLRWDRVNVSVQTHFVV